MLNLLIYFQALAAAATSPDLSWWESVDPEQRSDIQFFIAEANRVYAADPKGLQLTKRDCTTKFQLSQSQYDWVLAHLTGAFYLSLLLLIIILLLLL
jgi:hypothetical protein